MTDRVESRPRSFKLGKLYYVKWSTSSGAKHEFTGWHVRRLPTVYGMILVFHVDSGGNADEVEVPQLDIIEAKEV